MRKKLLEEVIIVLISHEVRNNKREGKVISRGGIRVSYRW